MVKIKLFSKNSHMHLLKVKEYKKGQDSPERPKQIILFRYFFDLQVQNNQ